MKYFLLLIYFVSVVDCVLLETLDGDSVVVGDALIIKKNEYIYNGEPSEPYQFPWLVAIYADQKNFCGGSIISTNWILTAAQCLYTYKSFEIRFGATRLNSPTDVLTSRITIIHPYYDPMTFINDIALIGLPITLKFSSTIQSIPLAGIRYTTFIGVQGIVAGWNVGNSIGFIIAADDKMDKYQTSTNNLKYFKMKLTKSTDCCAINGTSSLPQTKLCAILSWDNSTLQKMIRSNRGSPLITNEASSEYFQIGISTTNDDDSTLGHPNPSTFTRITSYLEWISLHTGIRMRL